MTIIIVVLKLKKNFYCFLNTFLTKQQQNLLIKIFIVLKEILFSDNILSNTLNVIFVVLFPSSFFEKIWRKTEQERQNIENGSEIFFLSYSIDQCFPTSAPGTKSAPKISIMCSQKYPSVFNFLQFVPKN